MQENIFLHQYTTFKVGGPARFFVSVKTVDELMAALDFAGEKKLAVFMLGGGSNILVADRGFDGLVIKNEIGGVEFLENDLVRVGAGENWDDFVRQTVEHGLGGLENLSWIPGTVGAAPVQNIGAYGVEVGNRIVKVEFVEFVKVTPASLNSFDQKECQFSYRDSFFKKNPGKYFITHVTFQLSKNPVTDISYKDLKEYFANQKNESPTIMQVRDAVIAIRSRKLPDWKVVGTAGSFFKNPIIPASNYAELKKKFPDLPSYPAGAGFGSDFIKIPLAWVLDNVCGYRGVSRGRVGVFQNQALVIVNNNDKNGAATAAEIAGLAAEMAQSVKEKTGIIVEPEVQYIGF